MNSLPSAAPAVNAGAPAPGPRTDQHGGMGRPRRKRLTESPGNRLHRVIVATLYAARDMADAHLDAHPRDCGCDVCSLDGDYLEQTHGAYVHGEMEWASLTLHRLAGLVGQDMLGGKIERDESASMADHLRALAAELDAIDAAEAEDDADQPADVAGKGAAAHA